MSWNRIDHVTPPVGRPVLVRTVEGDSPQVAFLTPEGIWYAGGALVQSSATILGATPTEWCEPQGEDKL